MSFCFSCDTFFRTDQALHAHCRDKTDHAYCVECQRLFKTFDGLDQHLENAAVHQNDDTDESDNESDSDDETHTCVSCNRDFSDQKALSMHLANNPLHNWCFRCSRDFSSPQALNQHLKNAAVHQDDDTDESYNDSDSDDETHTCVPCNRDFVNQQALFMHLANNSLHNWCFLCSRDFSTLHALNQHSSSRVHDGRTFDCPFCSKTFKVPSAIAHHIESGCHKITRHQVTAAVHRAAQSLNITPSISISNRIQQGSSSRTTTTYTATSLSFNGTSYECYLCHRTFRTLPSLNSHLASPAHDDDEFNCPKCKKRFTVISALVQHIESEVCGVAKFKQVEDYATALTEQFTRLLKF